MKTTRTLPQNAVPDPVREVCGRLEAAGHRAWVVGGCVRDTLLGRSVSDWDIATSAKPKQVVRTFKKVIPTGLQHGTVTVLWKGEGYEVTTLRGEGAYSDGRRPDEVFFVDEIESDLARRDFTVNALASRPAVDEPLVDPFDGLADLDSQLIRAVGIPAERFAEDGLRILRGARFVATLGFALHADTEAAFSGALDVYAKVSPERVREEWLKAMRAKAPSAAFEVMKRTGILGRTCSALAEQTAANWRLSLAALDRSHPIAQPSLRLAALFHLVDLKTVEKWLRAYRFSNEERKRMLHVIRFQTPDFSAEGADLRRWLQGSAPELEAQIAHLRAVTAEDQQDGLERFLSRVDIEAVNAGDVVLTTHQLAVRGEHVIERLGKPGRLVGQILRTLLDEVIEDPSLNTEAHLGGRIDVLIHERGAS